MYRSQPVVFVLLILLSLFNINCKQKQNNWNNQQALLETLTNNIRYYQSERADKVRALEESVLDHTRSRASHWKEVADKINSQLKPLESEIENLRQANSPDKDKLASLYTLICQYRDSALKADPDLASTFIESLKNLTGHKGQIPENIEDFYSFYFTDDNTTSRRIQLAKIHCDVLNMNNRILTYCNVRSMPGCILTFDSYSAIVGTNTEITRPGGKISIIAGMGAFSRNTDTKIWINRKQVLLNEAAYANKTITAPSKPGTYHIPVVITHINQVTGKMDTLREEVVFQVIPVCDN